jgi:hypothetical protein
LLVDLDQLALPLQAPGWFLTYVAMVSSLVVFLVDELDELAVLLLILWGSWMVELYPLCTVQFIASKGLLGR